MPPTIVFFNRFYAPDRSATAQLLTDVAEFLAMQGFDVTVVASRARYDAPGDRLAKRQIVNGVTVRRTAVPVRSINMWGRITAYLSYLLWSSWLAVRMLRRGTIVVVKTDPPLLCVPISLICRLRGAVLVTWNQDLYPEIAQAYGVSVARGPVGAMLAAWRNRAMRKAALNVAIGHTMQRRLVTLGVPPSRIAVRCNWAHDEDVPPTPDELAALRREWNIDQQAFVVAYSGNLGRAHEYATILDAAERLRDRSDIVFVLIGGGAEMTRLHGDVTARGLTSFHFAPYQPRDRLGTSLRVGDVHWVSLRPEFEGLIVPSKFFGICAVERGVLAIAAADGELSWLLGGSNAGKVVPPGDGDLLAAVIAELADDREACRRMGLAARKLLDTGYDRSSALRHWSEMLANVSARQ